jgi:hypothetical protein
MKYVAIILNLVLLGTAVFLTIENGMPDEHEYFLFSIISITPIISLITLFGGDEKGLIGLYFKRKYLEEKKRIEQLQSNL